jgi:hypothetical protein
MARIYIPKSLIFQASTTATTGGTVTLTSAAPAGYFNYRDYYANGATGVPLQLHDATSGVYEYSYGTLTYGVDAAHDTISSRTPLVSSSGIGVPIAWGAGTRNARCLLPPESVLFAENALGEFSDVQANASYNRLRQGDMASFGGGSSGRVVRYTSSATFTNAQNTDTNAELSALLWLVNGIYYHPGEIVKGLSGLTAGQSLFLGDNTTPLLSVAPTPTALVAVVHLGRAITTTMALFDPKSPIRG